MLPGDPCARVSTCADALAGASFAHMHIHVLEHDPLENPGLVADWAAVRGHRLVRVLLDRGGALPPPGEVDLLVIMGGPMNIYQHRDHPWLVEEKAFIAEVIAAGKPVLGICLGAQLLADALGGKVFQNAAKEIGWFPIQMVDRAEPFASFPETLTAMHWHGDTFTLPRGARHIAKSEACVNQAFLFGDRMVGLQFHIEMQALSESDLQAVGTAAVVPGRWVQSREELMATPGDLPVARAALFSLLDALGKRAG